MLAEQTATKRHPFALLGLLALYIAIPIVAQVVDPIISISSIQHLSYAIVHFNVVFQNFSSGTLVVPYLLNIMVIILWIFWIWAVLSTFIALLFRVTNRSMTPSTRRWLKIGAVTVFVAWQAFGHVSAGHTINQSGTPRMTPIVQTMRDTSATMPTTSVTVQHGQDLWGIIAQVNPQATPQQIEQLVTTTARLNNIANPDVIFGDQVIAIPTLGPSAAPVAPTVANPASAPTTASAPATPAVTPITVDAPSVASAPIVAPTPAPTTASAPATPAVTPITVDAPSVSAEAPIIVNAPHVGQGDTGSSGTTASLEMAAIALVAAGASMFALKRFRARQMVKRPKGMVPAAPEPAVLDTFVNRREGEQLYADVLSALSIATSLGAPRIDTLLVGKTEIVAHLETSCTPIPRELASYVRLKKDTLRFSRSLPSARIDAHGLPYGGLVYLGLTSDGEHAFVNAAGRGVVGIPNATEDVWRALFAQFAWTDWLRTDATFFYRSRTQFEVPTDLLGSQSIIAGLEDFTEDIDNETELRSVVTRALASASELQGRGTRASLANARMESDLYGMDVILARTRIEDHALESLANQIGRTDSMVMLVAQEGPENWVIDESGFLHVPSRVGELRIYPVTMNVATMLSHVAYMTSERTFIDNNLSVRTLRSSAQPLIEYMSESPGLHETLSPLANRIALILGIRRTMSTRDLALAALPGVTLGEDAFTQAFSEVQNRLGSALHVDNGVAVLEASVGTDIGLLLSSTNLRSLTTRLTGIPMANMRSTWSIAQIWGERLDAIIIDHIVDMAIRNAARSPKGALALYSLLKSIFGSTDRIELIAVAVAKAGAGSAKAMDRWEEVGKARQAESPIGTDSTFDPGVVAELQSILVGSS